MTWGVPQLAQQAAKDVKEHSRLSTTRGIDDVSGTIRTIDDLAKWSKVVKSVGVKAH